MEDDAEVYTGDIEIRRCSSCGAPLAEKAGVAWCEARRCKLRGLVADLLPPESRGTQLLIRTA